MQSKTIHTQNPQEEALSFIYKIKVIADETQNKLHQTYDSKKIDTKNFKALFEILNDFLNRLAKEVLFLEKKQDFIEDITNHFSNLIPDNKENYNSEDWKQLVEKATPVLQKDGDIDQDTDDAIRSIEEKKRPHELISFKNTISRSARTAMNKLHRMHNSKKIDKAQFKTLYGMIIDFINRLSK
jgi:ribosomal protein L19E